MSHPEDCHRLLKSYREKANDDGRTVKKDRFKILAYHSGCQLLHFTTLPKEHDGYHTYIAFDAQYSKCVLLRIHGLNTSELAETKHELEVLKKLRAHSDPSPFILMPREQFWHKSVTGRHLCYTYELIGPDLQYIWDTVGPEDNLFPKEIIRKVAKDALEDLAYLHAQGICHGFLQRSSLVLTYPSIDASDEAAVMNFFGQPNSFGGIQSLNDTCTGKADTPDSLDFKLKLQRLVKAFKSDSTPRNALDHVHFDSPPPELIFDHSIAPSVDIWDLGVVLTDLAAGQYEFETLVGGNSGTAIDKLRRTQNLLGPLPLKYLRKGSAEQKGTGDHGGDTLLNAVRSNWDMSENEGFEEGELEHLVDLLKKMLAYLPAERTTAEEALKHPFLTGVS